MYFDHKTFEHVYISKKHQACYLIFFSRIINDLKLLVLGNKMCTSHITCLWVQYRAPKKRKKELRT